MRHNHSNLLDKFESYLQANAPSIETVHPTFDIALQTMTKACAKRFRPMLMLSVVQSLNPLLLQNSLAVALAIEIFHTYSLIHDDLPSMDDASFRRGVETLHETYDEATAVLVGDALNTHSFFLIANSSLADHTKIDIIKQLSLDGGISGMIIGQAVDIYFENKTLSIDELKLLHTNKTAKLIASSLKIGAMICELEESATQTLNNIGLDIGLLFQIQDDILDITLDEKKAGKSTNKDEFKNSFVSLMGLDGAIDEADRLADKIISKLDMLEPNLKDGLENLLKGYLHRHHL